MCVLRFGLLIRRRKSEGLGVEVQGLCAYGFYVGVYLVLIVMGGLA